MRDLLLARADRVDRRLGEDDDSSFFGGKRQKAAIVVQHIDDAFLRIQEEIAPYNRAVGHGDFDLGSEILFD